MLRNILEGNTLKCKEYLQRNKKLFLFSFYLSWQIFLHWFFITYVIKSGQYKLSNKSWWNGIVESILERVDEKNITQWLEAGIQHSFFFFSVILWPSIIIPGGQHCNSFYWKIMPLLVICCTECLPISAV